VYSNVRRYISAIW